MNIYLAPSYKRDKKWMVRVGTKTIHFGALGYADYTQHHDADRMKRYLLRHRSHENWQQSGIQTAGFWSRWLLWNQPSLEASRRDVEQRFGLHIKMFQTFPEHW